MARPDADLGPLGDPPRDLTRRALPLIEYQGVAYRIHLAGHDVLRFGRTGRWRFDDPEREYGVLYTAQSPAGAFAETLLPEPGALTVTAVVPAGTVPVSGAALDRHALSEITFARRLRCVDLTGPGLVQIGADGRLLSGERAAAQRWGRALFTHPAQPDAILYRCRRDPSEIALALHERARDVIRAQPLGTLRDPTNREILRGLIQKYRLAILPT